ncbi:MAG: hypothetical protein V4621_03070 [Pseudomonadota bacterium]
MTKDGMLCSLIIMMAALAYLLMLSGLALWLLQTYDAPHVLLAVGGIVLLTSIGLLAGWIGFKTYKAKRIEKTLRSLLDESNEAVDGISAKLDEIFGENVGKAILLSALTGFIISRKLT